jgi:hypothetical protein
MTPIKEKTLDIITSLPDEKVVYFYNILQNIEALSGNRDALELNDSRVAFKRLMEFKGTLPVDFNYENELESVRFKKHEKYTSIG